MKTLGNFGEEAKELSHTPEWMLSQTRTFWDRMSSTGRGDRERLEFFWVKSNPVPLACKEGVWYLVSDKVPLFLSMLRPCYETTLTVHSL